MQFRQPAVRTVNIDQAKAHLSRLVDEVSEGDEIVIARAGRPVARLVPIRRPPEKRRLGILAGAHSVPANFDALLPHEIIAEFEADDDGFPR